MEARSVVCRPCGSPQEGADTLLRLAAGCTERDLYALLDATAANVPLGGGGADSSSTRSLSAPLMLPLCGMFSLSGRYRRVLKAARSNLGGNKSVTTDFSLHLKLF